MKNKRYYNDRANFMRQAAREAQTEKLRDTCLRAAAAYDVLAQKAEKGEAGEDDEPGEDDEEEP